MTFTHEIRTLGPDEVITEPGFYSMPLDRHHSQPCDGVSVTSGIQRKMELETPADVWAFHMLNPNRYPSEPSAALTLGSAMACMVEGGEDELRKHYMVLPVDKPNKPTAAQIAKFNEGDPSEAGLKSIRFWERIEADPRTELTADQWKMIVDMGEVVRRDPAAAAALGGVPEITMAWKDEVNDLWCLARPDQVNFSGMLSDYKKVATQGRPFKHWICDQRITQHGYDMQMAFAAEGFQRLTGEWPSQVGLVFQCDKPPYSVILRALEDEDLNIGVFRNQRSRRLFRECLDSGNWWGPGVDIGSYQRPDSQRDRLIEEMNIAGVAAE